MKRTTLFTMVLLSVASVYAAGKRAVAEHEVGAEFVLQSMVDEITNSKIAALDELSSISTSISNAGKKVVEIIHEDGATKDKTAAIEEIREWLHEQQEALKQFDQYLGSTIKRMSGKRR